MKRRPPAKGLMAGIEQFLGAVSQVADETTRAVESVNAQASAALEKVNDAKHTIAVKIEEVRDVSAAAADTFAKVRKLGELPPRRVKITRNP